MTGSQDEPRDAPTNSTVKPKPPILKLVIFAGVVVLFAYLFIEHRDELTLSSIAARETQFREFQQNHPLGVFGVAFAVYVVVTGLSLPGAAVLTLAFAWFFAQVYGEAAGFALTTLLVSFASTTGATLAFLLSRYLIRDTIQRRFGERLAKFDDALQREGAFYLFTLRLIPAVPFWVINLVMGVTPIRVWTFWWVSQLGMLAGTGVYVYAGTQIPSAQDLVENGIGGILSVEIVVAFILLGLFPLATKKLLQRFGPKKLQSSLQKASRKGAKAQRKEK